MLYLVTDPCYLLGLDPKNKDRIWNLCINDMDNSEKYEDRTDYNGVQKILSEELGINVLRVSDTGYGDWVNSISSTSEHIKIVKYKFCADTEEDYYNDYDDDEEDDFEDDEYDE